MLQGVATICTTHGHHNPSALPINLSTEAGSIGGVPTGGLKFGASHNAAAHMPCASMIDFYNGGGVDVACLGMAEVGHGKAVHCLVLMTCMSCRAVLLYAHVIKSAFLRSHAWSELNFQSTVTVTHLQCVLTVCVCAVVYA